MLKDEEIAMHCAGLLNACWVVAELDKLVEEVVPIGELVRVGRTVEELEALAQRVFDYYH